MRRALLAILLVLAPTITRADAEKARALFEQGRALVKAEKHAEACPLFEESLALEAALGTELNLALCWSKVGKLLAAQRLFESIARKTEAPDQASRHQIAIDGLEGVVARMPKIQIDRGPIPELAMVWIDGIELVDVTAPVPVDPGTHVVDAEGATRQTVIAVEGQVAEVVLTVDPHQVELPPGGAVAPTLGWLDGDRRPIVVAGAGGALLIAGTITGILTLTKKSDGIAMCDDSLGGLRCGPEASATLDTARTLSHVTTALFLVGGAAVATGIVWKYRERHGAPRKPDRPAVTGWISGTSAGFGWERTW